MGSLLTICQVPLGSAEGTEFQHVEPFDEGPIVPTVSEVSRSNARRSVFVCQGVRIIESDPQRRFPVYIEMAWNRQMLKKGPEPALSVPILPLSAFRRFASDTNAAESRSQQEPASNREVCSFAALLRFERTDSWPK